MKIIDAGVVVELVSGDLEIDALGEEQLGAPHLIDSEVTHVLRGLVFRGKLDAPAAQAAMDGFSILNIERFAADWLRPRMWELRHNLTAYDSTYVALTEKLEATSLLTLDGGLATAPGTRCRIELLGS